MHLNLAAQASSQLSHCPSEPGKYFAWICKLRHSKVYELRLDLLTGECSASLLCSVFNLDFYSQPNPGCKTLCSSYADGTYNGKKKKKISQFCFLLFCDCQRLGGRWIWLNWQKCFRRFWSCKRRSCPKPSACHFSISSVNISDVRRVWYWVGC